MMILQLAGSIRQRPLLCLGLMLYWIWINIGFQSPLLYPLVRLSPDTTIPSIIGPIAVSVLAYLVLGIWFKRSNKVFRHPWYIGVLAGFMMASILTGIFWLESAWPTSLFDSQALTTQSGIITVSTILLYSISSLCAGITTACLCIEWGRIFGEHGPRQVLFHGIVAFLGAALITALVSQLPPIAFLAIIFVVPVPMALCMIHSQKEFPRKPFFEHGLNAKLNIPIKFLITALLHGLSLGILLGLFADLDYENNTALLISYALSALLLFITAVAVKMDFNHLIYQVGFSLVALGSMLIALFYPTFQLGSSLQLMGFCYLHLLMWGLCSYLTKNFRLPATWVVALPTCAFMFGQLVGIVTSNFTYQFAANPMAFVRLFLVLTFVILIAALLLMSNRNYQTAWGLARPGSNELYEDDIALACHSLATSNELSQREAETLSHLVRGKNKKTIAKELFVSEETVKSHTHSIYRKLLIHSQQELIELFERQFHRFDDVQASVFEELP
ncbi:MAG: helix-turn-helix transcriptional regulator, partial [Coriobacteriales bacterium]|nr:helix-turn-helix transcriptional regulator [Coriobacteriales bacterium]